MDEMCGEAVLMLVIITGGDVIFKDEGWGFHLGQLFLTNLPQASINGQSPEKNPALKHEQEDMLIKNESNVSSCVVKMRSLDQIISLDVSSSLILSNTCSQVPLIEVNILSN